MDYKKLSDAIRLCGSTPKIHECKEKCPYYAGGDMSKCILAMTKDAANSIIELNKELENTKKDLCYAIKICRKISWCYGCKNSAGVNGCKIGYISKCDEKNDLYEWERYEYDEN